MLKIGDKAPNFKLMDDKGRPVSLSGLKGKKVVLYFYPKDDTPGCTKEACGFRDEMGVFKKKNTVVLGVSADSVESHQKFKKKYELPFTLVSDPEKDAIKAFGVWKKKSMYGKTYMGIERTTFVIDEKGKIEKIYPRVKVNGHIEEIINSLN